MTVTQISNMGPSSIIERFTVNEVDLTAAGLTQTINLKLMPRGTIVKGVRVKAATAFSGGGASAVTVSVGAAAGTVTTFSTAFDIFQPVLDTTMQMTVGWKAATYAADTLTANFTSVGGNLVALTAGVVWIDVEYFYTDDLTATAPAGNNLVGGGLL